MNALAALLAKLHGASMYGFASADYACQGQNADYIALLVPGGCLRMGVRCAQNRGVDYLFPDLDPGTARLDCRDDCCHVDSLVVPPAPTAHQDEHCHKVCVRRDERCRKVAARRGESCHKVCAHQDEHCH